MNELHLCDPRRVYVGTAADPAATLAQPGPIAPVAPPHDVAAEARELLAAARGLAERAADLDTWVASIVALRDEVLARASALRDEAAALLHKAAGGA